MSERPAHHAEGGGFRNPWPTAHLPGRPELLRWWWERARAELAADPRPEQLPRATPAPARPRAGAGELLATWIGHATWLLQLPGVTLLTDPQFSERCAPVQWAGPRRFTPPGMSIDQLPPVDAVLLSHDHYDHLDDHSVRALHARFGERLRWFAPLGYARWFGRRGIEVTELDWWQEATVATADGEAAVRALPAQHWTSRTPWDRCRRLWCSWAVAAGGRRVYFGGDSGWFPGYPEIGRRAGPFDLSLLPIGAYQPRWFMQTSHMDPDDAVRAHAELGGRGVLAGMHWGTWRLTDEDPLEPPHRARQAWSGAGGAQEGDLWIPQHGETRRVAPLG